MTTSIPDWVRINPTVAAALRRGAPVVALESTVITHGLPWPENLEIARQMETVIREAGAEPATIGVRAGVVQIGLAADELESLAQADQPLKVSRRDIPTAVASRRDGGTTVAATMLCARMAGLEVFATGGIGGVHRGHDGDVSADLPELARTRVVVVCSGAKSILDLPRTLEWLETAGVPVIGFGTTDFPAFFTRSSAIPLVASASSSGEVARLVRIHWQVPASGGVLVAVPCPEDQSLPLSQVEELLSGANQAAQRKGIQGKDLTPFLLQELAHRSQGATLRANRALLINNARTAAQIAQALSSSGSSPNAAPC